MASEVIRDVVIRVALEQADAKLTVDTTEATRSLEAFEAASKAAQQAGVEQGNAQQEAALKAANAVRDQLDATSDAEKASRALADAQNNQLEASLRAADALKQAGDGAFTFARGLALVTADTDEDLRETLETLAAYQGAFDIFRGGTDLLRGAVETQRALSAATAAGAAAEAARGTAVAATGAAAVAATPQLAAMNLVLGPVGVAVAGIGAALTLGYTLWQQWGDSAEDASARSSVAAQKALADLRRAQDEANLLRDQSRLIRGFQDPESQLASINAELDRIGPIASADSLAGSFENLLGQRRILTRSRRELEGRETRLPGSDRTIADQIDRIDSRLNVVNARIEAERPAAVEGLRRESADAQARQRLLIERAGVLRGGLQDRDFDLARRIAEEQQDIGRARPAIRAAEQQRLQRARDFDAVGGAGDELLRRATDADRLEDFSAVELRQLVALSGTFRQQVQSEEDFRAGRINQRPATVQDLGAAAQRELEESTATLETLRDQRIEVERELRDLNETLTNGLGQLKERIRSLEGRAGELEGTVEPFTQPGD